MLSEENLRMLREMNMTGMAESYEEQLSMPDIAHMSFDDRMTYMLHREKDVRDDKRLTRLMQIAKFRFPTAHIDHIIWSNQAGIQRPGLDRQVVYHLRECNWIRQNQFCLITGKTGTGKSWLGCAIGQAACKRGFKVRFASMLSLLEQLSAGRHDGTYAKIIMRIQQTDLLILDDLGAGGESIDARMSADLLHILEDRYDRKATLITSQYPVEDWHGLFLNPTLADAILDRVVHHSHRIDLTGETIRKLGAEKRNGTTNGTANGVSSEKKR